jgi:hypothetical protein
MPSERPSAAAVLDPGRPPVEPSTDALTAAIEPAVDRLTAAIQAPVDSIAFAVQVAGRCLVACRLGPFTRVIQAVVDAIAATIEALFGAVAATIHVLFDAVTPTVQALAAVAVVGERLPACDGKSEHSNQNSLSHDGVSSTVPIFTRSNVRGSPRLTRRRTARAVM